ncbi:response regulator transcription factor [Radiobacillus kanasensis]|uniref:response regulator transcription factor n=1 Tax=Radiobacillus kanasensis TaxID=2844358 RepID=UPI001E4E053E|nr:response regulator transcription factor [Radiobacillus kanasensis]UFT98797.1 response regulator transcription factor [Radiobacillus kanasensis]
MGQLCKVLIVDDEMLIRQGIMNYIDWESEGFQIIGESSNGEEALMLIEKHHPHIVITDIVMPVMNGKELVKVIKRDYPNVEVIVLSSFENFEYVHSAFQDGVVDYILKPKLTGEELLQSLHKAVRKIPDVDFCKKSYKVVPSTSETIRKVVKGYESSEAITDTMFSFSNFCFLMMYSSDHELPSRNKVISFLNKHVPSYQLEEIIREEGELSYLLNVDSSDLESIRDYVHQLSIKFLENREHVQLFLHQPFSSFKYINEEYEKAKGNLQQYSFYLPDQPLFLYDELPQDNNQTLELDRNKLMELYKHHQFEEATFYLLDYVDHLSQKYQLRVHDFKSILGNQMFNIIVTLGSMSFNTEALERDKYSLFATLNDARNIKEALPPFYQFLEYTQDIVLPKNQKKEHSNMVKLLEYVGKHYSEPLGLTELAEHFHFNPSYLSAYFSTHHEEGFNEYLNKVRIKKACELLENSDKTISTISQEVGYSDHSYFSKVFKKIKGVSPSHFRRDISS